MEQPGNREGPPFRLGDRSTSDVVVRLRTPEGRDEWIYCHSSILVEKSKYFAERLSDTWPTCQILDARSCVEVHCQESDFDYNVTLLRLLYLVSDRLISESWHGVRNALGVLRVSFELGCPKIVSSCVDYLAAVPWEEAEEEEILRTVPTMGPIVSPILSRLQPVDQDATLRIFLSALRFATSSPSPSLQDLKFSVQEQLEYMLTEDDDAPLVAASDKIKLEVGKCINRLFSRLSALLETRYEDEMFEQLLQSCLSDLSWACQICAKLEMMRALVHSWSEISKLVIKTVEEMSWNIETLDLKLKVIEVASKVLEAIGFGTVVLPTLQRFQLVRLWLPFARTTKAVIYAASTEMDVEGNTRVKVDGEVWHTMESAFISIILTLPSVDQAEILTEWLADQFVSYPDLTEVFEVWCYRSKVAKKRFASFGSSVA